MSRKLEFAALNGVFVDGCGHQHVDFVGREVLDGRFQAETRKFSGIRVWLSPIGGRQAFGNVHAIERSRLGAFGGVGGPDVDRNIKLLGLRLQACRVAVDDGNHVLQHTLVGKSLEDALGADAVGVTPCDANADGFGRCHGCEGTPEGQGDKRDAIV